MALKKTTIAKITKAMRSFISFMKYRSIGPHALSKTELKDLIRAGLIDGKRVPKASVARAYLATHQAMTGGNFAPKSTRDGAIDFLERMFARYADKAGEQFTADLVSQLEAQLMPFTERREGEAVYRLLRDKDIHKKYLANALKDQVENWTHRWKLITNTELGRAANYGAMDAILHNNRDKDPGEITVYKIGPHDSLACRHCMEFWFMDDGVTPRVYRISELAANGTNLGKKRADWKPTVDVTHPNERHMLVQLKSGFGFDKGKLTYKGADHDEFRIQRENR